MSEKASEEIYHRVVGRPIGKDHWRPVTVQPRRTARLRRRTVRDELRRVREVACWWVCVFTAIWAAGEVFLYAQGRS